MVRSIVHGTILFTMSAAAVCWVAGCTPAAEEPQSDVLAALDAASEGPGKVVTAQDASPLISIEAAINGQDADAPPGPSIVVGDPVAWTAVVTNLDTAPLTEIAVTDDKLGAATCPATELAVGASMTCTITSTAVEGQVSSVATVTAKLADNTAIEATDPTNHVGIPQGALACAAGGPYTAECQGASSTVQLSGAVTAAPSGATLTFAWTSDCPGAAFDDAASPTPVLTIDTSAGCSVACKVTLTVNDGISAPSTCQADVAVADTQGPVFDAEPADLTLQCEGDDNDAQVQAWLAAVTATDSGCGGVTVTNDFTAIPDACSGPVTVTWTATDSCGNSSTVSAELEVVDSQGPVFDAAPEALTLECGDPDNDSLVAAWLAAVTATDNCGDPAVTNDFTALPDACSGPVTITWTATDDCGRTATVSAELEVVDSQDPEFDAAPEALTLECGNPDNDALVAAWLDAVTATDTCGSVAVTNDFTALPDACSGPVTITWTATDDCNRTATVSASLEVVDTVAPVITLNGDAMVTVECHTGSYTELGASVSDQCDTDLTEATVGGDVVDVNTPGTYVVTYDAVDACGNAAVQVTRTVEVVDTTPPVVTVGEPLELWPPNHKYETYALSDCASVEDACDAELDIDAVGSIVSIYSDEPEDAKGNGDGNTEDDIVIVGPSSFQVRAERAGGGNGRVYGITFTVSDASGNEAEATCFIAVPHDQSGDTAVDDGAAAGYSVMP